MPSNFPLNLEFTAPANYLPPSLEAVQNFMDAADKERTRKVMLEARERLRVAFKQRRFRMRLVKICVTEIGS
jgi:hypothetical protein